MKRLLLLLILCATSLMGLHAAKRPAVAKADAPVDTLSEERLMAFTYYLHAALEAKEAARYTDLWALAEYAYYLHPQNATALSLMGLLYTAQGSKTEGLRFYEQAYELAPTDYWQRYSVALYNTGNKRQQEQAVRVVRDATVRTPSNVEAWQMLLKILESEGRWGEMIAPITELEKLQSVTTQSTYQKFTCYQRVGKQKKGEELLRRYLKDNPDDHYIWMELADALYDRGQTQEAERIYENMRTRFPNYPSPYYRLAYIAELKKDTVRQVELWREALECNYADVDDKMSIIDELIDLGDTLDLIPYYRSVQSVYPEDKRPYLALAEAYLRADSTAAALEACESLLAIDSTTLSHWELVERVLDKDTTVSPEYQVALWARAFRQHSATTSIVLRYTRALVEDSLYNEARTILQERVLSDAPRTDRALYYSVLGDLYAETQNWDSCFLAYDEALHLYPQFYAVLNNYAWHLARQGRDLQRAERMSQTTIQAQPKDPSFLDTYAWVLHLQGQDELALYYIQKAIKLAEEAKADVSVYREHLQAIQHEP